MWGVSDLPESLLPWMGGLPGERDNEGTSINSTPLSHPSAPPPLLLERGIREPAGAWEPSSFPWWGKGAASRSLVVWSPEMASSDWGLGLHPSSPLLLLSLLRGWLTL